MYYNGEGISQNFAEALKWSGKAAEKGVAFSQYMLGIMHSRGEGVTKSLSESSRWFRKAAEQGHANAHYQLGEMHKDGEGVAKDYATAVAHYRSAAKAGHSTAATAAETLEAQTRATASSANVQAHLQRETREPITEPRATIERIWVDWDHSQDGSSPGILIHIDLCIFESANHAWHVGAYFEYADGQKMIDRNMNFRSSDGQVSIGQSKIRGPHDFPVRPDGWRWSDVQLRIPHEELHLDASKTHKCRFYVQVFCKLADGIRKTIATSAYHPFTY